MVLSVDTPQPGGFIGPGYLMSVRTSIFGPFPETYRWVVDIDRATPLGSIYFVDTSQPITSVFNHRLWDRQTTGDAVADVRSGAPFSADIQITVLMEDRNTGLHIDGPTTFPGFFWDPYGGLPTLLLRLTSGTPGDGFGPSDRTELSEIHRSVVLPSYTVSALHLGLTGGVTIDLAPTTRAVRWTAEAFPPNVAIDPGTPNYYFNLGFVTPVVAGSAIKSSRVSFSPQLLVLPEACHRVQLDLVPGLVLELAELMVP